MSPSDSEAALSLALPLCAAPGEHARIPLAQQEVLRLFDDCAPGLRRYVISRGLRPEAADDVVQEAFLALFRHLCLGRPRDNLRGWLFQVAHRLSLKHRERTTRRQRREVAWEPDVADAAIDPAHDPETRLVRGQRLRRLRAVLGALPERDRQCLRLRAEGLRYREIAKTLGISLGAVAKSLAHAVMRLSSVWRVEEKAGR